MYGNGYTESSVNLLSGYALTFYAVLGAVGRLYCKLRNS